MKKRYIILLIIAVLLIRFLWTVSGKKYKRLNLLFHKEYISNDFSVQELEKHQQRSYYLIKKYRNSEDYWIIGFSSSSGTTDYYGYGIADANKKTVIPPIYEHIYTFEEPETKCVIARCKPFIDDGFKYDEFFKIEGSKATFLKEYEEKQRIHYEELRQLYEGK